MVSSAANEPHRHAGGGVHVGPQSSGNVNSCSNRRDMTGTCSIRLAAGTSLRVMNTCMKAPVRQCVVHEDGRRLTADLHMKSDPGGRVEQRAAGGLCWPKATTGQGQACSGCNRNTATSTALSQRPLCKPHCNGRCVCDDARPFHPSSSGDVSQRSTVMIVMPRATIVAMPALHPAALIAAAGHTAVRYKAQRPP